MNEREKEKNERTREEEKRTNERRKQKNKKTNKKTREGEKKKLTNQRRRKPKKINEQEKKKVATNFMIITLICRGLNNRQNKTLGVATNNDLIKKNKTIKDNGNAKATIT